MHSSKAYSVGLHFFVVVQAYKEWKIISSFTSTSTDSREENRPLIEVPLDKPSSSQGRSLMVNPEMYKVNFCHLSTRVLDMEVVKKGLEEKMRKKNGACIWLVFLSNREWSIRKGGAGISVLVNSLFLSRELGLMGGHCLKMEGGGLYFLVHLWNSALFRNFDAVIR